MAAIRRLCDRSSRQPDTQSEFPSLSIFVIDHRNQPIQLCMYQHAILLSSVSPFSIRTFLLIAFRTISTHAFEAYTLHLEQRTTVFSCSQLAVSTTMYPSLTQRECYFSHTIVPTHWNSTALYAGNLRMCCCCTRCKYHRLTIGILIGTVSERQSLPQLHLCERGGNGDGMKLMRISGGVKRPVRSSIVSEESPYLTRISAKTWRPDPHDGDIKAN